jgi:hypothetical protein
MMKSIKVEPKRRGRPATGKDPLLTTRAPRETISAIEAWASKNGVTRSEAIRRLVELGLTVRARKPKQAPAAGADRAKELASKAIDKMGDPTVHPDERAQRRRRLTKGPEEFREVRVDRPPQPKR